MRIFAEKFLKTMGRDGRGDAWKHRQWKEGGIWGNKRKFSPRKLADEPQFKFDDVFITPLRLRRHYADDGTVSYTEFERKMAPTGIRIFDAYLHYLTDGNSDLQVFADRHGLRVDDIDSLVFVLTGMRGVDFRQKYQVRIANQLLRYTDMTVAEVAKRSGIGSANNLYLTYKREYNLAPGYRRQRIRQPGDLGRFKL
jgi:AraC-like DNA-binding protein